MTVVPITRFKSRATWAWNTFFASRGLGHAFAAGIDRCLLLGADIIVNTDGDNQYSGVCIPQLIRPILDGRADIVIGDREPEKMAQFSWLKKKLQIIGSRFVSQLAGIRVPDVASGFRAYSREAAMRLVCSTDFDHTVDHVIQAGHRRIITASLPIATNDKLRDLRLFGSITEFIHMSGRLPSKWRRNKAGSSALNLLRGNTSTQPAARASSSRAFSTCDPKAIVGTGPAASRNRATVGPISISSTARSMMT
jgi:glycosyltransferase involved in cell wall biosynthesis